jgi:hypothetical protein
MALELTDDLVAREPNTGIAPPQVALIFAGIDLPWPDQIAGALPHPQERGGLRGREHRANSDELRRR